MAPNNDRQTLGHVGEDHVIEWYAHKGFTLADRNWRMGRQGELDLVFTKDHIVVVVEVKTRRTDTYGSGLEAVTATKQLRLRKLATAWLREHRAELSPGYLDLRIDVAAVKLQRGPADITVIEGAC